MEEQSYSFQEAKENFTYQFKSTSSEKEVSKTNRQNGEQIVHKKLQDANQFLKKTDLTIVFESMKK